MHPEFLSRIPRQSNVIRRISLSYPNGTSTSYTYDVASRLTNINHIGPSGIIEAVTYQYDAAGNRTSLTRNNGTASVLPSAVASAAYDAANEQTAFAGATLTYDANGNLTNDGVSTYQWDARNRLIGMSGGSTASFNYDALGRRTSKVINSVASQFLYDGNDIAAEIGGGAVAANYLRSLNIDEPFIRQTGTGNEFYHTDALGSALALSNAQGAPATTYGYEPFGKTTVTGTSSNVLQFTGRENDGTGLAYYRARYYHPTLHRFISEDPREFEGGDAHLYVYGFNNPLLFTDPSGEIAPLLLICLRGAGMSVAQDILSGRKPDYWDAGLACLTGGLSKANKIKKLAQQKKGGRRGQGHQKHAGGDSKQVDAAAQQAGAGLDQKGRQELREKLSDELHDLKRDTGRGNDNNFYYSEIKALADRIASELRQQQSSSGTGSGGGGNQ